MRQVFALAALAAMLAVTGCVQDDPIPTLPPTPTVEPVFESEEEALAAAEEAYAAYVEASNLIASEGGIDPERIDPFVTEERLQDEYRGFASYRDNGIRLEGSATFRVEGLQSYTSSPEELEVVFYACSDFRSTRIFDASGEDVTPVDRPATLLLEVVMVGRDGKLPLVVARDDPWSSEAC